MHSTGRTGAVKWKYKSTSVPTDILQVGSNIYFGSFQDRWSAAKLQTGEPLWTFSTGVANPECHFAKSPVSDENHVYITGIDGVIYSLDAASGRTVWKRKLTAAPSTSLAIRDKSLFVGTSDNRIYRLNSQTGENEAEIAMEAQPVGRPTLTGDSLIFFLENKAERAGFIVALTPNLAKVRWIQRSTPDWASERPHVARGLIIAGNCRGELCFVSSFRWRPEVESESEGMHTKCRRLRRYFIRRRSGRHCIRFELLSTFTQGAFISLNKVSS